MRKMMWSRPLLSAGLLSLGLFALPAAAAEQGTQVTVNLKPGQELPDVEKMVQALEVSGGEHKVMVKAEKRPEGQHLTLKMWGNTVPLADIPGTLREGFPVLAQADIQASLLDPSEQPPTLEGRELEATTTADGRRKVIKKVEKKTVQEGEAK
jgi:hypothetical protein